MTDKLEIVVMLLVCFSATLVILYRLVTFEQGYTHEYGQ